MTAADFLVWRERLGLNARDAAKALGCARNTIAAYEHGRVRIPRYVELACAQLSFVFSQTAAKAEQRKLS